MTVFLNGKFVPEEKAVVSVFDRGFLYGDSLFEGILVAGGRPFRWDDHLQRLQRGVTFLRFTVPLSNDELLDGALELVRRNKLPDCMLRLTVTRGITGRTYSPKNAVNPSVVMTLHPAPAISKLPRWRVITASIRLMARDPLAEFKTANKIRQVLAKAQADASDANEAILLNTEGKIAEGTTSNVFWIKNNIIYTPKLPDGALPGVTRSIVLELCGKLGIRHKTQSAAIAKLRQADAAFLTMTSMGIVEMESLDGRKFRPSTLVDQLWSEYRNLLTRHCQRPPTAAKATRPCASPSRSNRG